MKITVNHQIKLSKWWKTPSAKKAMQRVAKAKRKRLTALRQSTTKRIYNLDCPSK